MRDNEISGFLFVTRSMHEHVKSSRLTASTGIELNIRIQPNVNNEEPKQKFNLLPF